LARPRSQIDEYNARKCSTEVKEGYESPRSWCLDLGHVFALSQRLTRHWAKLCHITYGAFKGASKMPEDQQGHARQNTNCMRQHHIR